MSFIIDPSTLPEILSAVVAIIVVIYKSSSSLKKHLDEREAERVQFEIKKADDEERRRDESFVRFKGELDALRARVSEENRQARTENSEQHAVAQAAREAAEKATLTAIDVVDGKVDALGDKVDALDSKVDSLGQRTACLEGVNHHT